MATKARERLLQTAEELFYAEGIRACGVERILEVSGVGRASFYRHFQSKDELVLEVLRGRDVRWRAWLEEAVAARGLPATERPAAVFDALAERFGWQDFRGCAFINTMVEAADPQSAAFQAAADHKRRVVAYLDRLLDEAGYAGHKALARQFMLLVDGAIVAALRDRTTESAGSAKAVAVALLAAQRAP
ncbi:helix-turn-helix domain-containing protein [Pengzhenrongella sp.]|jgi:AcrR family transcriptional regulator|uniref:TetR/AcrR family transcriptional regulator n=1 Tax=Pengzhenrongella sp. TaxID=2888820 RepID=UPI002F952395